MALKKILIAVKTYPTLSKEYDELVCTAGFLEDGSWIRIYPIPYRKLDYKMRYKKYDWIELDVTRNSKDLRVESYRPTNIEKECSVVGEIDTENNWAKRKEIVLKHVWHNMSELIEEAKKSKISLAVLKPKDIIDFTWTEVDREWNKSALEQVLANQKQLSLFCEEETSNLFKIAKKLPYEFSYTFTTEDGKSRTMMIEDWEIGMLYWHALDAANGDEEIACKKVKQKFFDEFKKKDLYFFLGTTLRFHNIAPNPFIIIGTFYPPKVDSQQTMLF